MHQTGGDNETRKENRVQYFTIRGTFVTKETIQRASNFLPLRAFVITTRMINKANIEFSKRYTDIAATIPKDTRDDHLRRCDSKTKEEEFT